MKKGAINGEVRPRQILHTGSVLASGLAINARLLGEEAARKRVLKLFPLQIEVFRLQAFLVVRFSEPARLDAATAPGAPLVRYGRLLSMSPLEADEQAALAACAGAGQNQDAVVLIENGFALASLLDAGAREDLAAWIDVSALKVIGSLVPLGDAAMAPEIRFAEPAVDIRQSLGMERLDGLAARLLRALQSARAAGEGRTPERPSGWSASPSTSWLARTMAALGNSVARILGSSWFGHLLGRQYAKHLARLLAMFDANDLDNALSHAVPLSAAQELARRSPSLWFSLAWSGWRRKDLSISPKRPQAATSIRLDQRLFEMLRTRYRQAFERLAAAGQIEKAAFVLAELLNADEEAVSFLERHGRLKLAAEIAEMRKLAPGLVIRQWFLAGERERAIHIAQRTGAFADAVFRLEVSHREEGKALRLLWAHRLASAGAFVPAVDVVKPMAEARNLALGWIDRAIEVGGPAGARMLARKAAWLPEAFPELRERALTLLDRDGEEAGRLALAFGEELLAGELTAEARALTGATIRALLRESGVAHGGNVVKRLLDVTADSALRVDARPSALWNSESSRPETPPLRERTDPVRILRAATDRGAAPVQDAAETADGRLLVAIGEAGALLLSRSGGIVARFAEPASRIVMSDNGDRAILLARRGENFRMSRLDLTARRSQPWRDARFDEFAPDFDGLTWFVACDGALFAIDATDREWRRLWKVSEDDTVMGQIRRNASSLSFRVRWAQDGRGPAKAVRSEVWTYDLPSLILRRREAVTPEDGLILSLGLSADGALAGWKVGSPSSEPSGASDNPLLMREMSATGRIRLPGEAWVELPLTAQSSPGAPCLAEGWAAMPDLHAHGATIHFVDITSLPRRGAGGPPRHGVRAVIDLDNAGSVGVRIQGSRALLFDQCGRVLVVSLETGAVLREHRIT